MKFIAIPTEDLEKVDDKCYIITAESENQAWFVLVERVSKGADFEWWYWYCQKFYKMHQIPETIMLLQI